LADRRRKDVQPYELTPARRAVLERAQRAAEERAGFDLLARMDPDDGLWTWESSPHLLWLEAQLRHVCWLPPELGPAPAPARAREART
jgi:hypothetical protein